MYVDRKIVKIAEFLLIDYLSYVDLDKIYVDWFILFIQSKKYLDDYNMHLWTNNQNYMTALESFNKITSKLDCRKCLKKFRLLRFAWGIILKIVCL